jgi:hypothetical protein
MNSEEKKEMKKEMKEKLIVDGIANKSYNI